MVAFQMLSAILDDLDLLKLECEERREKREGHDTYGTDMVWLISASSRRHDTMVLSAMCMNSPSWRLWSGLPHLPCHHSTRLYLSILDTINRHNSNTVDDLVVLVELGVGPAADRLKSVRRASTSEFEKAFAFAALEEVNGKKPQPLSPALNPHLA